MPLWSLAIALTPQDIAVKPPKPRFEVVSPLALPSITVDSYNSGYGIGQAMSRAKGAQGRMLWVDGTANLDKVANAEMVRDLVAKIKSVGFNTIVFDVKPISGQVLYKSKIAPKIESWRGKSLPVDFDPLDAMSREAQSQGIELLVSLNAFSEGHSMFKVGPGYDQPLWQTVIYDPIQVIKTASYEEDGDEWAPVESKLNEMPKPNTIAVFTDPSKIAPVTKDHFAISIDKNNRLVSVYEMNGKDPETPKIPAGGGVILVAHGGAIHLLEEHDIPGTLYKFDTGPRFIPISQRPEQQYPLMMNPHHPEVQERALAIIDEIMRNYPVKGILYDDRLRYGGMNADFSPLARNMFEKYVGKKIAWPDDVFKYTLTPTLGRGIQPGPYYDAWLTWRSLQMKNWVAKVQKKVKSINPQHKFGVYAGSWYGEYASYGTNYGSNELDAGFWFMTKAYRETGFASNLDMLVTGCYYKVPTIYEAMNQGLGMGRTVEAAGQLSNRVARDQTWVYAGISLDMFKGDPAGLGAVLQAACASTQGVMVFDLSHDITPMWPVFEQAFNTRRPAPHQLPGLLGEVRKMKARYDKMGVKDPPLPILTGSSGVGF